jgi:hypothetical protein
MCKKETREIKRIIMKSIMMILSKKFGNRIKLQKIEYKDSLPIWFGLKYILRLKDQVGLIHLLTGIWICPLI